MKLRCNDVSIIECRSHIGLSILLGVQTLLRFFAVFPGFPRCALDHTRAARERSARTFARADSRTRTSKKIFSSCAFFLVFSAPKSRETRGPTRIARADSH